MGVFGNIYLVILLFGNIYLVILQRIW